MYPENRALLLVSESYNTADMYYATRFLFPDPAILVDPGNGNSLIVCTDFERDVAARESKAARVHGFRNYGSEELIDKPDYEWSAEMTLRVLSREGITQAVTTSNLPLYTADYLRANGVDLICHPHLLHDLRERKDVTEVAAIEVAQRATERAMRAAVQLVAASTVGAGGVLEHDGQPLTAERLRAAIDASLMEDGCSGDGTITASGPDSAEPHNRGAGPIRAGQPIVIDIFPRHQQLRYFADMTRTICKGEPDDQIARMYDLTNQALDLALGLIKPGVIGKSVHDAVCRFYEDHGYQTYLRDGKTPENGLTHSLGHGIGLEVHEGPHLGRKENELHVSEVITVEPGLYFKGLGGVRIEDAVVVTEDGCRNLTNFEKVLVL
jgi:Xaa-Pro aminopeptidase